MCKSCKYDSSGHLWTTVWCWIWLHVKLPPWKINMEPTEVTYLKRKMIWTKPRGNYVPCQSSGVYAHVSCFHTILPFCARVGWTCFSMVQKTPPLDLFLVCSKCFGSRYMVGQHIITGHWNSLKNWRWIERYPCVSVSSAQKNPACSVCNLYTAFLGVD